MTAVSPDAKVFASKMKTAFLRDAWPSAVLVFLFVLVVQLVLVAMAGTDVPFHDQWDIEGHWLYPKWREGSLTGSDLLQAFNEHRILWTHLLNLGLFVVNGQWDPLVQLVAIAIIRAACAAGLAAYLSQPLSSSGRIMLITVVAVALLPHLPWHAVLWGIESHAYFSLGLSLLTLGMLGGVELSLTRTIVGLMIGICGLFAMGPSALVPIPLLGLAILRIAERWRVSRSIVYQIGGAVCLLAMAVVLRAEVRDHDMLKAQGVLQFFAAALRVLGWPHASNPYAAIAVNLPILIILARRIMRKRRPRQSEDFVLLVAGWSVACALATAWARGGSAELQGGVPSRYVDFIIFLPLANVWCAVALAHEGGTKSKSAVRVLASAWGVFLLVGWIGLSMEVMRWLVVPRVRDREAPVRLMRAFQQTGDAKIFQGQPLLLVPHPSAEVMRAVLNDPRMNGALPPSLQPDKPVGPLSHGVRVLLRR